MLSVKDAAIVYETLLSAPGMSEPVKIALQIPRKNVLLLAKLIEHGLLLKDEKTEGGVLATLDQPTANELKTVAQELLSKAGLSELHDRLTALQTK